jgi:ATP-dependent Clp protease ATP-binding subunit ClpB
LDEVHRGLLKQLEKLPKVSGGGSAMDQIYITGRLQTLLTRAEDEAKRLKDEYI